MLPLQITLKVINIFYIHRYGPTAKNKKLGSHGSHIKWLKTKTKSSYMIKKLRKLGSIFVCFHLSWVSEVFSNRNHSSRLRTTTFSDVIHNNVGLSFQNYLFGCPSSNSIVTCESRKGHSEGIQCDTFVLPIKEGRYRDWE